MGQKLSNAPVYFTIAQVRFNPILSLDSYIPAIQENFRKSGYPDYKKIVSMAFNLTQAVNDEAMPTQPPPPEQVARYVFSNMTKTRGFVLHQNSLSFQVTEHDSFDQSADELLRELGILNQLITLSYSERVGVRYLDAIAPRDGETLKQYLVPEVLGLYGKLNGQLAHSFSETLTLGTAGAVMSRTIIQNGRLGFPPDLQTMGLTLMPRFANVSGEHAILDTDGFIDRRETFDLDNLKHRLHALHDEIIKSFRATVTTHALSVWK